MAALECDDMTEGTTGAENHDPKIISTKVKTH